MRLWLVIFIVISAVCAAPAYAETLDGKTASSKRMPHKIDKTSEIYFLKIKKRAEGGFLYDQFYFAEMLDGKKPSFLVDPVMATAWYRRAAEAGNEVAQFALGERYEAGNTVDQDYQKAFAWYMRAAERRNAPAIQKVAQFYLEGRGVEKDKAKAYYWYMRQKKESMAAEQLKIAMTADELARAERMLFLDEMWQTVRRYVNPTYQKVKKILIQTPLGSVLVGFFLWFCAAVLALKYRPSDTTWRKLFEGPAAAAGGAGLAFGSILIVLSYRSAVFVFLFFILLAGMGKLVSILYGLACVIFFISCWTPPLLRTYLQSTAILIGIFATGFSLGALSPILFFSLNS